MAQKVLVIDDNQALVREITMVLTKSGFEVLGANGGQEGLKLLYSNKPDLVLLDLAMPGMDGWQVCSRIREMSDVPIIILTGQQNSEDDIVRGLDYGADEYLLKPVGNRELVARVRAVMRRSELCPPTGEAKQVSYTDDFLTIDIPERRVIAGGKQVKLTPIEFRLLALLLENAGHLLTHKQILEKVWGWEYADDLDYVRIYISHLRQKLEPDPAKPRYFITESGVGYQFQKARPA